MREKDREWAGGRRRRSQGPGWRQGSLQGRPRIESNGKALCARSVGSHSRLQRAARDGLSSKAEELCAPLDGGGGGMVAGSATAPHMESTDAANASRRLHPACSSHEQDPASLQSLALNSRLTSPFTRPRCCWP